MSKLPFAGPAALVYSEADRDGTTYAAQVAAEHHRALAEAIEAREGARAEALAREHSRLSRRNLEIALQSSEARKRVPGAALIHRPSKTN